MNPRLRALLIAVILATPVAAWWFAFVPENRYIRLMQEDLRGKETMLDKLREETSRNRDLQAANEELKLSVQLIEERLPDTKEIDAIVRQVTDLALISGLEAPAIKSAKPVASALYMEQPLEMEVKGNFPGFFRFISEVEKLPRITRIHDMTVTSRTEGDVELNAKFTLSIYFQDERALAGAENPR